MKTRSTKVTELAIKVVASCALLFALGLFMVNPAFAFADTLDQTSAAPVAVAQQANYAKTATANDETPNTTEASEEVIVDNSTPTSAAQDVKVTSETGITTGRNAGTTALFVFGIAIAAFVVTAASVTVATRRKK